MQGVHTGHVHEIFHLVIHRTALGHGLVQPFGIISIHVRAQPLVAETVSQLERQYLLVLGILVDGMARSGLHESTVRELRRTADIS